DVHRSHTGAAAQPIATQGRSYRNRDRLQERPCVATGRKAAPKSLLQNAYLKYFNISYFNY
ncbi:MAG: hypothetical protein ACN6PL_13325, partial [Pseudomonas putida]